MGVVLISLGGVGIVALGFRIMMAVNRADQRRLERLRADWEANASEEPWTWGVNWGNGGGSGG